MRSGDTYPAGIGVATALPTLDFETYSEAGYRWDAAAAKWCSLEGIRNTERGLGVVGTYNYVQHPTFEVLCLSYNLLDGTGWHFWRPPPDLPRWPELSALFPGGASAHPKDLLQHVAAGKPIAGWNSGGFEFVVWNEYCVKRWGWPPLTIAQLHDDMAKARAHSLPGKLENTGAVLQLTQQKDKAGGDIMRKLTTPRNPTKANPALRWTPATAAEDFARLYSYNVQDGVAELEASVRIPDLCPREREIWEVDQAINHRGMQIDLKAVGDCIAIVEQATQKYHGQLRELTHHRVETHSDVAGIVEWMRTRGVHLPGLDEDVVAEQLKLDHPKDVLQVLKIRQLLGFGSVKKLYALRVQTCADGRLRGQYAYHGAHTALWNGQGVQVANLYKPSELWAQDPEGMENALAAISSRCLEYVEAAYGDALECVANCLRSLVVAAPGNRLIASDFTAIQAVVAAGLAGEEWILEVFRTHGKIYEAMASRLTGTPLQVYLDFKKQHGKHHPDRQLGKLAALSAFFGAWINGWKRFGAEAYGDDEWLKQTILKTRDGMPAIVELWGGQTRNKFRWNEQPELYGLEGAAISAVLDPGTCYAYRSVRFCMHNDVLYCQPPGNGAPLVYHEPRLEPSRREYARPWELELTYMGWNSNATKGKPGWQRMKLYGGLLTQNADANVARQFQADGLVRCERSGIYLPVMHTHDEIVTEVADGRGSKEEYLTLINVPRAGCYDDQGRPWPIKAPSADETHRYGKWE